MPGIPLTSSLGRMILLMKRLDGRAYRQFLVELEAYVLSLREDDTLSLMGYQEVQSYIERFGIV